MIFTTVKWITLRLLRLCFGFRGYGLESVNTQGPVLMVPNHSSWLDWLFLGALLPVDWKFVVSRRVAESSWLHRKIMLNSRTFPLDTDSPYAVKHMAQYLEGKGRLVLFAEGQISHTGNLMKLFDGVGFLLHKSRADVITAYIRGANRLKWSRQPGWRKTFPRVSVHFNRPQQPPHDKWHSTTEARYKITTWLRNAMVEHQFQVEMVHGPQHPIHALAKIAAATPSKICLEDITGQSWSFSRLLIASYVLSRCLKGFFDKTEPIIGVLLPNTNAAPGVLFSLWRLNKTAAVLNYSTGVKGMKDCCQLAHLKTVITSRAFLDRLKLDDAFESNLGVRFIYLEDLKGKVGISDKLTSACLARFEWEGWTSFPVTEPEKNTAVILFTSGSEGQPKGVMLTHKNIMANSKQLMVSLDLEDHDRVFNAMPLFHSFGMTLGTLLPLFRGMYVFLYPSPLHYRLVPTGIYQKNCSIFLSTNTFLKAYARRAHPYDFRSLRGVYAGAEKIHPDTFQTWGLQFGIRVMEGYGATECSPCVSVNTSMERREGSAGQLLPGIETKLHPVEGVEEGGKLFIKGPNVMAGYLNPEANERFKSDQGWYDTGDIAKIDEDGFLFILGRIKRFAKVSGEMVSLTAVEDALNGAFPQFGMRCEIAVINVPDEEKGEILVAITNEKHLTIQDIRKRLIEYGLPNLAHPRQIIHVQEIPKLGTGKTDYVSLNRHLQEGNLVSNDHEITTS